MFVSLGYSARATARLKVRLIFGPPVTDPADRSASLAGANQMCVDQNPKGDDELLISRLLFLTSYDTNQDFAELIDNHGLADHINDVSAKAHECVRNAHHR